MHVDLSLNEQNKSQREAAPSYLELQEENARLKVELLKSKVTRLSKCPSSPRPTRESPLERLENRTNLQHGKSNYRRKVWTRSDIFLPTKSCSATLLQHGFTWTSWIHFAVHIQKFELEHESAWSSGPFLHGDTLWLAIYFGFIAVL